MKPQPIDELWLNEIQSLRRYNEVVDVRQALHKCRLWAMPGYAMPSRKKLIAFINKNYAVNKSPFEE